MWIATLGEEMHCLQALLGPAVCATAVWRLSIDEVSPEVVGDLHLSPVVIEPSRHRVFLAPTPYSPSASAAVYASEDRAMSTARLNLLPIDWLFAV